VVLASLALLACGGYADERASAQEAQRELVKQWLTAAEPVRQRIFRASDMAAEAIEQQRRAIRSAESYERLGGQKLDERFAAAGREYAVAAREWGRLPGGDARIKAASLRLTVALQELSTSLAALASGEGDPVAASNKFNRAQAAMQDQFAAIGEHLLELGITEVPSAS
jgi:hypothetical protein